MELTFLGRETGLAVNHISAYFVTDNNELVVIDCSVSAFQKLKQLRLKDYTHIYVHITHTHSDHVGGLSLFVQYMYFTLHRVITIIAPSYIVKQDIKKLLSIEGCADDWYVITDVEKCNKNWINASILTDHTPQLHGKCFGYSLNINGKTIIYTGDTNTLEPFEIDILGCDEFYVDVAIIKSPAHLNLVEALEKFLEFAAHGTKVYLMHLDNIPMAEEIVSELDGIQLVHVE